MEDVSARVSRRVPDDSLNGGPRSADTGHRRTIQLATVDPRAEIGQRRRWLKWVVAQFGLHVHKDPIGTSCSNRYESGRCSQHVNENGRNRFNLIVGY